MYAFAFQRLFEGGYTEFQEMDQLFPLIHFLDGSGSSFSHWCRMVKSQGAKPIIFVDSEYSIRVNQQIDDDSVPVIVLPDGREFENLIPEETYFEALSEITDIDDSRAKFKSWENDEDLPPKMIFTNRIKRWLQNIFEIDLDKPMTMKIAIQKVEDLSTFQLDEFEQLVLEKKIVH